MTECTYTDCSNTATWTDHDEPICLEHAAEVNERIIAYAAFSDDAEALAARGLKPIE